MFVTTHSGQNVDLELVKESDILIDDIAHSLSMQCRFNGHTSRFMSVAQHSMLVASLVRQHQKTFEKDSLNATRLELTALLHDAAETYVSDVTRPVKLLAGSEFIKMEERFHSLISKKYGLYYPFPAIVHHMDEVVMANEAYHFMPVNPTIWGMPDPTMPGQIFLEIAPMDPDTAKRAFLHRFESITSEARDRAKGGV